MAIRNLRYDTDPILHKVAKEVEVVDDKVRELIKDMFETMEKFYGVGLAAPQVGISKRIIVIDTGEKDEKYALINPKIISMDTECIVDEGCLSYPGLYAKVRRNKNTVVEALDENGEKITINATGLLAQALQHEINHLDGIVFVDLAEENSYFAYGPNDKKIKNIEYDEINHKVRLKRPR